MNILIRYFKEKGGGMSNDCNCWNKTLKNKGGKCQICEKERGRAYLWNNGYARHQGHLCQKCKEQCMKDGFFVEINEV